MQKLAETGWHQMRETLREHGLSADASELKTSSRKRTLFYLTAACVFFIFILSYPFILNDKNHFAFKEKKNPQTTSQKIIRPFDVENETGNKSDISKITPAQKRVLIEKINAQYIQSAKENSVQLLQYQKTDLWKKFALESKFQTTIPRCDKLIDTAIQFERSNFSQKKNSDRVAKKIEVFAGAGFNISTSKNYPDLLNAKNLNLHPEITVFIPLNKKLSLHTGLSAFSTVHGKEVSTKEKELVNSFNSNIYYNINTTSIIKASYFDLPVTLHYLINKNWSVGSGFELSKLYKVSVREQKESFDYNNTLASATVSQFTSTPMRATAAFEKKLEIQKFEPRFVVETSCKINRFLLSAGYHYTLGKTITLKDSYNSTHQYRNEYFKLGVQYKIGKK